MEAPDNNSICAGLDKAAVVTKTLVKGALCRYCLQNEAMQACIISQPVKSLM